MNPLTAIKPDEIATLKQLVKRFKKNGESVKRVEVRRSKVLIVGSSSYDDAEGGFQNEHWAYKVPFAFRDALDIQLSKLQKTEHKQTHYYCAWTQGCLLNFSSGDFFQAVGDTPCLQVAFAKPVVLNTVNGVMDDGEVTYELFEKRGLGEFFTVSQFEFLRVLIYGIQHNELKKQAIE